MYLTDDKKNKKQKTRKKTPPTKLSGYSHVFHRWLYVPCSRNSSNLLLEGVHTSISKEINTNQHKCHFNKEIIKYYLLSAHTCKHSSQLSQCIIFTMDVKGDHFKQLVYGLISYKKNFLLSLDSFHASGDFSCLLTTFANSLDPDQGRLSVGPDLEPNCLTLIEYFEKWLILKSQQKASKHEKLPSMQRV